MRCRYQLTSSYAHMIQLDRQGPTSGAVFNPAVALGLSISSGLHNIMYCIMVSASTLLGGVAAAGCFRIVVPSNDEVVGTGENTPLNRA